MTTGKVAPRLAWAVKMLDPRPSERVLEIGCGHGVAVDLVAQCLVDGHVTGLDRSQKMIEAAERRNAAHIAAGRASFVRTAIETWDSPGPHFDAAFAINVIAFANPDHGCHAVVRRALGPGGRLCLCFQPPGAGEVPSLVDRFTRSLAANGFAVERAEIGEITPAPAVGVVARPT